ncbi:MAG: cobalbumin biosynthesis enzyme, partial [Dehalococcoidia bacterium]|nr:cobalbumin biosynthesis enzyme [Dehalococcoidia bacterium]
MAGKVLILGGLRSGKSRFAVELAARRGRRVLFVATATAGDAEMKRRIESHRKARPPGGRRQGLQGECQSLGAGNSDAGRRRAGLPS